MANVLPTPKGLRLQIGAFGRRNVGKSSTLNALARQNFAIVSDVAGATTDPVEKALELAPLGPILFVDTAGVDDESALGASRIEKTRLVLDRVDLALIIVDATLGSAAFGPFEEALVAQTSGRGVPNLVVVNKTDAASETQLRELTLTLDSRGLKYVPFSAREAANLKIGAPSLREALTALIPEEFLTPPPIVSDLVPPGAFVVLVTPIDKEAPKGRLILPQVQTIRDLLDGDRGVVVVKENLLAEALNKMVEPPALIVTDSQAFKTVASIAPRTIPLTSFSILFARQKGDLKLMVDGARAIAALKPSSRVLIAEACSHHPIEEDIGTVKIPRLLRAKIGPELAVDHVQGADFPDSEELKKYDLIVHCGGCVFNRRGMLTRIERATSSGVPITNYGLAIAALNGILERATEPLGI